MERYVRSVQGQEGVRLLFRLRTGSAGLLEDNKRCETMRGVQRVLVVQGKMWSILVTCGELERDRWELANEVSRTVGLESGWRNMEECARVR